MNMREVKERAARMGMKAGKKPKTELIRMIQKSEGNTPCFQTGAFSSCGEMDCCWRPDCSSPR